MKKTFFFILQSCLIMVATAQNSYYYCDGNKIALVEHSSKIVTFASKSNNIVLPAAVGVALTDTISDSRCNIKVYELTTSNTPTYTKSLALSSASVNTQSCYKTEEGRELIPDGYINVKLKSASDLALLRNIAGRNGCVIVGQNSFMPLWYSLHISTGINTNPVEAANAIYETGYFAAASPSFAMDALEISYDPNVYEQWGLYNSQYESYDISISKAWNYATGKGIKIAIVDQGIELTHQDLAANIYPLSYDTESGTSPSNVYGDHGTHCAGIAAAVRNNGIQIAGVAPDARLMSVSTILINDGNLSQKLANGINWVWKNGADIISCSWWCNNEQIIREALDSALTRGREGKGCIVVKSAGNSGKAITFPGDYKDVIAVAAMAIDGSLYKSSSHGEKLFVTAPGTNILSTICGNAIGTMSGTSMAAPHVAGVAALILERNPSLSMTAVREIIGKSAKKVGTYLYDTNKEYGSWNERYGYGLIDAYNAVISTPR